MHLITDNILIHSLFETYWIYIITIIIFSWGFSLPSLALSTQISSSLWCLHICLFWYFCRTHFLKMFYPLDFEFFSFFFSVESISNSFLPSPSLILSIFVHPLTDCKNFVSAALFLVICFFSAAHASPLPHTAAVLTQYYIVSSVFLSLILFNISSHSILKFAKSTLHAAILAIRYITAQILKNVLFVSSIRCE